LTKNVPVELSEVHVTVPVGVAPVTRAVQFVEYSTDALKANVPICDGAQATAVVVVAAPWTETVAVPELFALFESPWYLAVIVTPVSGAESVHRTEQVCPSEPGPSVQEVALNCPVELVLDQSTRPLGGGLVDPRTMAEQNVARPTSTGFGSQETEVPAPTTVMFVEPFTAAQVPPQSNDAVIIGLPAWVST
jgi:hypothetical protein